MAVRATLISLFLQSDSSGILFGGLCVAQYSVTILYLSRYGRVNYVLARRLELLREVGRLQESLDVPGDVSYTCETAGHFYLYQVRMLIGSYFCSYTGSCALLLVISSSVCDL